jgi:hypothetical protein
VLRLPLVIIPLGLSAYWFATESGLYWAIAKFEADLVGNNEFHPTLAFLGTLLAQLAPAVLIMLVLTRFFPAPDPGPDPDPRDH